MLVWEGNSLNNLSENEFWMSFNRCLCIGRTFQAAGGFQDSDIVWKAIKITLTRDAFYV